MRKIMKRGFIILLATIFFVSGIIFPQSNSSVDAGEIPSISEDTVQSGGSPNTYYFVALFSYDVWKTESGWNIPSDVSGVTYPYEFDLPNRKITNVTVSAFNNSFVQSNPSKWRSVFNQSRYNQYTWDQVSQQVSQTYSVDQPTNLVGKGTSSVSFNLTLKNAKLDAPAPWDICKDSTHEIGDPQLCADKTGKRFYFSMLLTITTSPQMITKSFDINGNSLESVFPTTTEVLENGKSYSGKTPPSNSNYSYVGYKKSASNDGSAPTGDIISGTPPSFTYSNNFNTYFLVLYYKKSDDTSTPTPTPPPSSKGTIHVREMVRSSSSGSFSKVDEQTIYFDSLPGSRSFGGDSPSYGTFIGRNQNNGGYLDTFYSFTTPITAEVSSGTPEVWVTLFYQKDTNVTGDFFISPGYTITYGDQFSLIPTGIDVKSCTFNNIQFKVANSDGVAYLTNTSSSQTNSFDYYSLSQYPSVITGSGSYSVSMVINTSCGQTWVGPKTLNVKENNPPNASIYWLESGTDTHTLRVAQGSKVDLKVGTMSDPDGDPVSIVGWDMSATSWLQSLQGKYHFSPTASEIDGIVADEVGSHTVKLTVTDDKGATYTATSTLDVVDPRPVAVITAPTFVKENHPLPSPINGDRSYSPAKLPIVAYEWSENKPKDGDTFHTAGTETLTLKVQDSIGRWSDPATQDVTVTPDEPPIVSIQVPAEVTRLDNVTVTSKAYSPDGDTVVRHVFFMKYDANNNGFADDAWIQVQDGSSDRYSFKPNRVGKYLFSETAYEDYGKSGNSDTQAESLRLVNVVNLPPWASVSSSSPIPDAPNSTPILMSSIYNNGSYTSLTSGGAGNKANFTLENGVMKSKVYKSVNFVQNGAVASWGGINYYNIDGLPVTPYSSIQGNMSVVSIPSSLDLTRMFVDEKYSYAYTNGGVITAYDKSWNQVWTANIATNGQGIYQYVSTKDRLYLGYNLNFVCSGGGSVETGCSGHTNDLFITINKLTGQIVNSIPIRDLSYFSVTKGEVWVSADLGYTYRYDLNGNSLGTAYSGGYAICDVTRFYDYTSNGIIANLSNDMPRCQTRPYVINSTTRGANFYIGETSPVFFDQSGNLYGIVSDTSYESSSNWKVKSFRTYDRNGALTEYPVQKIPGLTMPGVSDSTGVYLYHKAQVMFADSFNQIWFYATDMSNLSSRPQLVVFDGQGNYKGRVELSSGKPDYFYQGKDGLLNVFIPYVDANRVHTYQILVIDPKTLSTVYSGIVPLPAGSQGFYGQIYPIGDQAFMFNDWTMYGGLKSFIVKSNATSTYPSIVDVGDPTQDVVLGTSVPAGNTIVASLTPNQVSSEGAGFVFFARDSKNYYSAEFEAGQFRVKKTVNGSVTTLFSKSYTIINEKSYDIKISPEEGGFGVYVNKVKQTSLPETAWTSGSFGIINRGQQGVAYTSASYFLAGGSLGYQNGIAIAGEPINYTVQWQDDENDPRIMQKDKWVFTHNPNVFLNSLGTWSDSGKTLTTPPDHLDLPGEYKYTFVGVDDPNPDHKYPDAAFDGYREESNQSSGVLRVHRRPIADFNVTVSGNGTLTYTDQSYDPDRYNPSTGQYSTESTGIDYRLNHGVVYEKWRYRTADSTTYVYNKPTRLGATGTYVIELAVQDEYGAYSDWDVNVVSVEGVNALPPIPGFTVSPVSGYRTQTFTINSTASDPQDGDRSNIAHQYFIKNLTTGGSETLQSESREQWQKIFNSIGTLNIRQVVTNSFGLSAETSHTVEVLNHKPVVTVSTPASTNAGTPTKFDVLRPNFVWTYSDADGDGETNYQLQFYKTNGVLVLDSGSKTGGATNWTPSSDLPEGPTMYVIARAYDGYEWGDWSVPKYFYIDTNKPPISSFTCKPSSGYEGDIINCKNTSYDPDGDAMTFLWTVTGPNSYSQTFTTTDISIPTTITTNRPGTYSFKLRATDSKGAVNVTDATGTVYLAVLSITGQVNHATAWEQNRQKWNTKFPNQTRSSNVFWAGESFVLIGSPTITSNAGGSDTTATSVIVTAIGIGTTSLSKQANGQWTGTIDSTNASVSLQSLSDGGYNFVFTAKFSNGVTKTDTVPIVISGKWTEYFNLFRDF